jgi:hypothetical protein
MQNIQATATLTNQTAATLFPAAAKSTNLLKVLTYHNSSATATVINLRRGTTTVLASFNAGASMTAPVIIDLTKWDLAWESAVDQDLNIIAVTAGANVIVNALGEIKIRP